MLKNFKEPISVNVDFDGTVRPKYFFWKGNRYDISKVQLMYKSREGENVIYYFEVTDNANYFKLAFYSLNLRWYLEGFQDI